MGLRKYTGTVFAGLMVSLFALLGGCNFRHDKSDMPLGVAPTFSAVQQYVIGPKCMSCHFGAMSPMGVDLTSYETMMARGLIKPKAPMESSLYLSIAAGRMPKGSPPLPENVQKLVFDWIDKGAAKDGIPEPPAPPPEPTYEWIAKYVFEVRCVRCHDGKHEKTKFDLRTYESLMAYEGEVFRAVEPGDPEFSSLFRSLRTQTMPPIGDKLGTDATAAIEKWIAEGAKKEK